MDFMPSEKKELREVLRFGIKTLILQEVRVLQLERAYTPSFIVDEIARSIQEAKRQVISLVRLMPPKERNSLIKRFIRQSIDEEIDRAIQLRENKCIRCIHGRFYDELGTAHMNLPIGITRAKTIGCDKLQPSLRKKCRRFIETSMALSLGDYLNEMTLLYELREIFDRFEEIWKDYFLSI
jgi:hypothetical protein